MTTTAEKLQLLINTKSAIKSAIIAKGQAVADSDTFASYANKILSISSGEAGSVIVAGVLTGVASPIGIIFTNTTTSATSSCTTDTNGNYVISVPEGTYEISLSDTDYKTIPDTLILQAITQNFTAVKNYIQFEDSEVGRLCAEFWGDYDERVITDNGNNTVNIVDSFVSMRNRSEVERTVLDTQTNVDNSGGTYTIGTTKSARGITMNQCRAVTKIGDGAYTDYARASPFRGNTVITTFPELKYFTSITLLDRQCFSRCTNLEYIDVTNIIEATYQFVKSTKITSLVFEEGFTGLTRYGTYSTEQVTYLDLPSTTTTIGEWNFRNHNSMVIVCRATTPPSFAGNNNGGKRLYVPQASLNAYTTAWPYFANNNKLLAIEGSYYETHRELDPNET